MLVHAHAPLELWAAQKLHEASLQVLKIKVCFKQEEKREEKDFHSNPDRRGMYQHN